jgi:hypothetical protein
VPGGSIDTARAFQPFRIAVLTISDSRDSSNGSASDLLVQRRRTDPAFSKNLNL